MFYETATAYYKPEDEKSVSSRALVAYFWIGFAVCIFSTVCSFILAQIHESVIDSETNSEVKAKKGELKANSGTENDEDQDGEQKPESSGQESFMNQYVKGLSRPLLLFMVINSFGYASMHAFYPNMSKFFQTKFQFSNVDAGHISSIPYLIASFTVPIFGTVLNYFGD